MSAPRHMQRALDGLAGRCDFADVRRVESRSSYVEARDRRVLSLGTVESVGCSVRVLVRGCWGFASVNDEARLAEAAEGALGLANASAGSNAVAVSLADIPARRVREATEWREDVRDVALEEKKAAVERVERALAREEALRTTATLYRDSWSRKRYLATDGSDVASETERVSILVQVKGRRGDLIQETSDGLAGVGGFELVRGADLEALAAGAAGRVVRLLGAAPAPAGTLSVVMDPELVGVFVHEAVGHACEADQVLGGTSVFAGRMASRVGSEHVTIVDDPTLAGHGHYLHDSEGVLGVRTVLVEGGMLVGLLTSRESASRLGLAPNGHARASSYSQPPIVRMSNTHLAAGDRSLEELLEGIGRGVYMCGEHGGVVNPASGEFLFKAKEGRLIERGELGAHVRDAAMTGQVARTLLGVAGVGRDARLVHQPGMCGKHGQYLPIDMGGPHVRVEGVRIGGSL